MSQFMGNHLNRLDAKGRVSIPAAFRAGLRPPGSDGVAAATVGMVLRPSHTQPCIDAWPTHAFERLATPLEHLDLLSEAHEDLATAIYADAFPIESDREGRIILPPTLSAHAGLGDSAAFMGMGRWFQIWEPQAAERRRAEARERTRARAGVPVTQLLSGTPAG
jgi:MraZ protein